MGTAAVDIAASVYGFNRRVDGESREEGRNGGFDSKKERKRGLKEMSETKVMEGIKRWNK